MARSICAWLVNWACARPVNFRIARALQREELLLQPLKHKLRRAVNLRLNLPVEPSADANGTTL
jgi:hypothetical protein